jgi:hypothetical protein
VSCFVSCQRLVDERDGMAASLGRQPTFAEWAAHRGITVNRLQEVRRQDPLIEGLDAFRDLGLGL